MNVSHLINELEAMHEAKVVESSTYSYPLFTVNVSYYPVQKTPMDILMKMMLIAFQKAPIQSTEVLASILLVEPLFIADLTEKMVKAGLIVKGDDHSYQLTEKGTKQLEAGIFEEQLELVQEEILYSDVHESEMEGDIEMLETLDDIPESLSYASEHIDSINEQNVVQAIQLSLTQHSDEEESAPPIFINAIESFEIGAITDIPISIFTLEEKRSGRTFTRVFNHFSKKWDDMLATFVSENEKSLRQTNK